MLLPVIMADVIANFASWIVLLADVIVMMSWNILPPMLISILADVIAKSALLLPIYLWKILKKEQ